MIQRAFIFLALCACSEAGAPHAKKMIADTHMPRIKAIVNQDFEKHRIGVAKAATHLATGFELSDAATQETEMRKGLRYVQRIPKGIVELMASPMSFLAAVGKDGKVIARDAEPDRMKGLSFGVYAVIKNALEKNESGIELVEIASSDPSGKSSQSILFVAPALKENKSIGAIVAGIPLWRLAQRLSKQLQVEQASEKGVILWAYVYKNQELFQYGTPPELKAIANEALTQSGKASSKPMVGEAQLYGRWYAWGVAPLKVLGANVGVIVIRSDAPK